jgi:hypothetical protein
MTNSKLTKEQLLKIITKLEKKSEDKIRILGDTGITVLGTGLGAVAAGAVATATGATSLYGITTAASWFGITAVASTPVGWIIGSAVLGGTLAYSVSRIIHNGGVAEGRKLEILQKYREASNEMEKKEISENITEEEKASFELAINVLIDHEVISSEDAFELIKHVESGSIPLSYAFSIIKDLLADDVSKNGEKSLSQTQINEQGYISDEDFEKRLNNIVNGFKNV